MEFPILKIIHLALIIMAVSARRNHQSNIGLSNSGGSGNNYLKNTESNWQGQWFTGSCKSCPYNCQMINKLIKLQTMNITLGFTTSIFFIQLANAMGGQEGADTLRISTWNPVTEESAWIVMETGQDSIVNIVRKIITSRKKQMNRAECHV